jgi:hypothetical protein
VSAVRREDLPFLDAAPVTSTVERDLPVPPDRLFDALVPDQRLTAIRGCRG